mmetsp:Transcript_32043/g.94266  ORF Transcript_32043/g.94266 Transcript_32043/m.94266 type:complete len:421 (-) Transcript_32043:549-1811(-)
MSIVSSIFASFSSPPRWSAADPSATTTPSFLRSELVTSCGALSLSRAPRQDKSAWPVLRIDSKWGNRKAMASSDAPFEAAISREAFRALFLTDSLKSARPYVMRKETRIFKTDMSRVTFADESESAVTARRTPSLVAILSSLSFSTSACFFVDEVANWLSRSSLSKVRSLACGILGFGMVLVVATFFLGFVVAVSLLRLVPPTTFFFGFFGKPVSIRVDLGFLGAATGGSGNGNELAVLPMALPMLGRPPPPLAALLESASEEGVGQASIKVEHNCTTLFSAVSWCIPAACAKARAAALAILPSLWLSKGIKGAAYILEGAGSADLSSPPTPQTCRQAARDSFWMGWLLSKQFTQIRFSMSGLIFIIRGRDGWEVAIDDNASTDALRQFFPPSAPTSPRRGASSAALRPSPFASSETSVE